MTRWALPGMALAEEIGPRLIRCHGASVNGFLALSIKERLGIPCVVSLHSHSGDVRGGLTLSLKERFIFFAQSRIERLALSGADAVVYLVVDGFNMDQAGPYTLDIDLTP